MQLRYLRSFVAVVETRNLSRAAKQLHIAQPAMSRQIHDLERVLEVPLFVRHAKGVTLTTAGEALAPLASQFHKDLAAALDRTEEAAAGRRGRVVLGAMRAFVALGFTGIVQEELRREHADITLVVQDIDSPDLIERLRDGSVDLALTVDAPHDAAFAVAPLWHETVDRALVPAGHRLAKRRSVTVSELGELSLVLAREGYTSETLEHGLAMLRAHGLRSPLLVVDAGLQGAHIAVAAGRGWTLVSRARAYAPPAGTVAVPVRGLDLTLMTAAAWRRSEHRPVVRTVCEKVFEVARRDPGHRVPEESGRLPLPAGSGSKRRRQSGTLPPSLELRHLRALVAVAAARTIGRAAEQLGLAQPSLSRQLRELEHVVGVPLLERSARGVRLTPAGVSFAGDCPALLRSIDRLVQETIRARRGMEDRCVIGAVATSVTSDILTRVVTACATEHPQVHLLIEEMPTPRQLAALQRGEIDLGLGHAYLRLGADDGLTREHLIPDRVDAALVSRSHQLARHERLRAADLADVPFLFIERSFYPPMYDRVMASLKAIGLTPHVEGTYDGLQALWAMVAQGRGWCIGFRSQRARPPSGTVAVPISGLNIPWGIDLLRRAAEGSPSVLVVAALVRAVRATLANQAS